VNQPLWICLAMTMRWTWLMPPYIWMILASRIMRPSRHDDDVDSDRVIGPAGAGVSRREGHPVLLSGQGHQCVVHGTSGQAQATQNGVDLSGSLTAQRQRRREPRIKQVPIRSQRRGADGSLYVPGCIRTVERCCFR
jgi:hypothetical protein